MVLLVQCLKWLATAYWPPMPLRDALVFVFGPHTFLTGALGLDNIVQYLLDTSMVPWLMLVAPLLWASLWAWVFNGLYKWVKWVQETPKIGNLR
jgi:hypothetical protein